MSTTTETYKALVATYEVAKTEQRWDDARNAAVKAHEIGASLTDEQRTVARDEVLARPTEAPVLPTAGEPRYIIVKAEAERPCRHPLCGQLHVRQVRDLLSWKGVSVAQFRADPDEWHMITDTGWLIIDTTTGERPNGMMSDWFETKREAKSMLDGCSK